MRIEKEVSTEIEGLGIMLSFKNQNFHVVGVDDYVPAKKFRERIAASLAEIEQFIKECEKYT